MNNLRTHNILFEQNVYETMERPTNVYVKKEGRKKKKSQAMRRNKGK